jgi:hypothetical protein
VSKDEDRPDIPKQREPRPSSLWGGRPSRARCGNIDPRKPRCSRSLRRRSQRLGFGQASCRALRPAQTAALAYPIELANALSVKLGP